MRLRALTRDRLLRMCLRVATPFVRRLVSIIAVATVSGCSASEPSKEIETLSSWTASVQLARMERLRGKTTRIHAAQIRDRATEALAQEQQTLAQMPTTAEDRQKAAAAMDSLRVEIAALAREVGTQ